MRLRPAALLAPLVLLTALASPLLAAVELTIPPIPYHQRTLPNGLQVLSVEDHASPNVAVQVWYHVGSKDDPQGRSGFAHLFEHLMFKSTKHMHAEQFDRLTEDVGGANNASTGDDVTNYFEVVPSNHLQTLLWAEAERLSNLNVDEANFKSERAVVEEEYRQSVLANPYGKLFNAIDPKSYTVHPYKRPTIGSIEDLEAATLPDVVAFHQTFYRPDNATLIVAGDFDPKQLDAWVDQYFGWIAKPATPIPQVTAQEPKRKKNLRYTVTSETAPLPAVAITWLLPPASDTADSIPLKVAAALLSQGDSSRLYQSLVYRHQVAQQAGADADGRVGPGLFTAYAILASGHQPAEAEKLLHEEIIWLATQPIPAAELDKVKTQLLTGELKQRQTAQGLAFALGQAALIDGNPEHVNTDLAALQKVTEQDVHRVLQKYVTGARSVTIDYLPQAAKGATK
ncbi:MULTISPECIES: pitrilysin family protein [unclassified Rhodanobacter]|uniref:M16 family metallopeptidase n=1 Tax=unclassified Rhodanobacter TaxID=2621553 RepID=UPI001BDE2D04|nr:MULTISPECIES: pitrilysin family protein [unclassified Rhodanobacter]MBT2143978.1 insulinase family protein [Rhodanobacter sp. LX-99]MBT2146948.1 insulinase family protein [Rhodanobacter sp. LX-100]